MTTTTIGERTGASFTGTQDAQLRSASPTNNFPTELESGGAEMIFRFTGLSNITGPVVVSDAFFTFNVVTGQAGAETIHFQKILRAWVETEATWNIYSTGNNWGTAGCNATSDRDTADSCVISYPGGFATGDIDSTTNSTLIAEVEAIINGTLANNGWKFLSVPSMAMPANATATIRPILTVVWESAVDTDQSHFRWGVDDGSESAHGWEAAEDTNITVAADNARLLRLQADIDGDLGATAFTLRSQKNGSGGYAVVPVGATSETTPVIEAGDCTLSGNNTAQATWAVSHPAAAAGDLLIFNVAWDDSTDTTSVTAPAGPNSEVLTSIEGPVASSGTEVRCQSWYTVATGSWSASTVTFTPSATESWSATVIKVLAGEFDSTTPIGANSSVASAGTTETEVDSPAFSAGATDGNGKLVWFAAVDADPLSATNPTGCTILQQQDLGAVAHGVAVRNTAVADSESIAAITDWAIASDSWASIAYVVRAPTINNEVYIPTSANVTAGGEATTARLTAPAGKTTGDFTTGRRWDDENGTDTIDIANLFYSEFEWPVHISSAAAASDFYDFRLYAGTSALTTYGVTPRWSIPSVGSEARLVGGKLLGGGLLVGGVLIN